MLINGQPGIRISIADRGLAYGDGVFETIRCHQGKLLFGDLHLQRLERGCRRLGIAVDMAAVRQDISLALQSPGSGATVLKLIVTRGEGGRGYKPATQPGNRILSLHPLPDNSATQPEAGIRAFVCRQRLAEQAALAGIKHLNRLEQVLASSEWPDDSFMEGVMLDHAGRIIEGTRSNLFLVREGRLCTPDLQRCGIDGIMRQVLLGEFAAEVETGDYTLEDLKAADEAFFCNSVFGVWPLVMLQQGEQITTWPAGPWARRARTVFNAALTA